MSSESWYNVVKLFSFNLWYKATANSIYLLTLRGDMDFPSLSGGSIGFLRYISSIKTGLPQVFPFTPPWPRTKKKIYKYSIYKNWDTEGEKYIKWYTEVELKNFSNIMFPF